MSEAARAATAAIDSVPLREAAPDRDIPIVDVGPCFAGRPGALEQAADALRRAQEEVGFYYLVGHGVPQDLVDAVFAAARRFHALPEAAKLAIRQNAHNVGYMPLRGSVTRANALDGRDRKPNAVAALFLKRDLPPDHPDVVAGKRFRCANQWPAGLPGFREACVAYCEAMEALCRRLLPVYAVALDLPPDYFAPYFEEPMYTLRLSHYPPVDGYEEDEFGLAPHADTSFMTLLAQNEVPGLAIRNPDEEWLAAPVVPGAFVTNTGQMLQRWTNGRFRATPHSALNLSGRDRYAIPFFFDASVDAVMECLPTCHGPANPPKHGPTTYSEFMSKYARANYASVRAAESGAAGKR